MAVAPIFIFSRPHTLLKTDRNGLDYTARRWAWRMRRFPPDSLVVLVGLDEAGQPVEAFQVPADRLAGKKFVYRNIAHPEDRVGSFLDEWQIDLSACGV